MKKLLLILVMSLLGLTNSAIFFSQAIAGEIVMLKSGRLVQLNDDMTWEYFENAKDSETGKVVLTITKAVSKFGEYEVTDDFEKFSHYASYVSCQYELKATNKTEFTVKLSSIALETSVEISEGSNRAPFSGQGKILEPGDSHILKPNYLVRIRAKTNQKTESPASAEQIEKLKEEFGCSRYSGKLYLHEAAFSDGFVKFAPEAGISDTATWDFVIGSANGVESLDTPIRFYTN